MSQACAIKHRTIADITDRQKTTDIHIQTSSETNPSHLQTDIMAPKTRTTKRKTRDGSEEPSSPPPRTSSKKTPQTNTNIDSLNLDEDQLKKIIHALTTPTTPTKEPSKPQSKKVKNSLNDSNDEVYFVKAKTPARKHKVVRSENDEEGTEDDQEIYVKVTQGK
jgi:hypothetical protein